MYISAKLLKRTWVIMERTVFSIFKKVFKFKFFFQILTRANTLNTILHNYILDSCNDRHRHTHQAGSMPGRHSQRTLAAIILTHELIGQANNSVPGVVYSLAMSDLCSLVEDCVKNKGNSN